MESLTFSLYHVLVLFAVFQSLLLICIFIFNKNFSKKANYALSLTLLFLALMCLGNIVEDLELSEVNPIFKYIPFFSPFLLPFGLYYFIVFLLDANYQFSKKDYWFFIPLMLQLGVNLSIFFTYLMAPDFIAQYDTNRYLYYRFSEFIMLLYWLYIILFTLKKTREYHQQLFDNFSEIEGKSLFWLRNVMLACLGLWVLVAFSQTHVFLYKEVHPIFYFTLICISILIYWLSYFIILRRDIFEIPTFQKKDENNILKSTLSDKTEEHYQNLLEMIQKEKLYQDAQLNMDTLAEKTALSNGYLSKIINQKEGKNFYDFINSYRVKEVKTNLTNPDYAHYSILGVGLEAGFKSKSTFNAVFKKMTGMTPSAYKKSLS